MKKPYIICHMMTSVDGRIDCAMTEQLPGVEDYYQTLDELNVPTTISGRVTAELEMAKGIFEAKCLEEYGKMGSSKKCDAKGYEVILDTKGKLSDDFEKAFDKICEKLPNDSLKGYTQENIMEFKEYKKEIKSQKK